MKRLPTGIFLPGNSLIHQLDSRIKILALLITIFAILLVDQFIGYGIMALFIICTAILSEISLKIVLGSVNRLLWFFIVIFLMNTFFYSPDNAWFSLWIFTPSSDGMRYGMEVVIRVFLVLVVSNILTSTTAPMEITHALENLMSPFSYIGIPTDQIAMILSIAIQFIPTIAEETETIRKAQTARGARLDSRKFAEKAQAVLPMLIPTFLAAFKRADELSIAMEARGYHGASGRTKPRSNPLHIKDLIALAITVLVCLFQVVLRVNNL